MGRVIAATASIFFSLILGAAALAAVAVIVPGTMESLLDSASWVRDQLTNTGLAPKYNVWVKFLIADQQLVFMGFVIVMRILLALLFAAGSSLFGRGY